MTYEHWPIDANSHRFISASTCALNASERLAQEHAAVDPRVPVPGRRLVGRCSDRSLGAARCTTSTTRRCWCAIPPAGIDDVEEYKAELAAGHVAKHPANNVEGPK
jgi:hypothetical protein